MTRYCIFVSLCIFIIFLSSQLITTADAQDSNNDRQKLREFVWREKLKPIRSEPFEITKKYILGQALFFDPILSTNNDVSCSTCHLPFHGTSDGLRKSIGTGGVGIGNARKPGKIEKRHTRNSQALWNRDDKSVISLFWDGRVEVLDPKERLFRTPLKNLLPKSIENVLAAQALFPIVNIGEMFAHNCDEREKGCLINNNNYKTPEWIRTELNTILLKILGTTNSNNLSEMNKSYRALFNSAYPDIPTEDIEIGLIGNAIAHFEEIAFATRDARWDKYIIGNDSILSDSEIKGALLFYGKGRCHLCHKGAVFSDYSFHSLGIVSYQSKKHVDSGRYKVTGIESDKFKFRTPALRNVTITAPYMHDGSVKTLTEAVKVHFDSACHAAEGFEVNCKRKQKTNLLQLIGKLTEGEIKDVLNFLFSLEDDARDYMEFIVPRSVPSGFQDVKVD